MQLVKLTNVETGFINYVDMTDGEVIHLGSAEVGQRISLKCREYTVMDAYDHMLEVSDRLRSYVIDLAVDEVEARQSMAA